MLFYSFTLIKTAYVFYGISGECVSIIRENLSVGKNKSQGRFGKMKKLNLTVGHQNKHTSWTAIHVGWKWIEKKYINEKGEGLMYTESYPTLNSLQANANYETVADTTNFKRVKMHSFYML